MANNRLSRAIELLEQMVNMDSPSMEKALVDRFARFAAETFRSIGGKVDYVETPKFGDHLRIRFEGGSAKRILILGHTDTVFPSNEAVRRPFRIEGGRAMGPGVFDMKAGIVLAWWALADLMESGTPSGPITVLLTSDEEVGSNSSRTLIESEAEQAAAVLVLEPSLPGGALKTSRKGVGRFTIKAVGRAAHAGVDPENGANAILEIAHQIVQLARMSEAFRGASINVGVIHGGTRANVVPAEAAIEVDVRVATIEEAELINRDIRALAPKIKGTALDIRGGINRPPMERTTDSARLFELARTVAEEIGIELKEGATGGASDGNFTAALGVPTLDGLGAVGNFAHGLDEFVNVADLPSRAALISGLIRRIQGSSDNS